MTSFLANEVFGFVSDQPEIICAVVGVSETFMNSSVVPSTLSDHELWDRLCAEFSSYNKVQNLLTIFSQFSDTMQFTKKLRFPATFEDEDSRAEEMLKNHLITKRYFTTTLQHLDCPTVSFLSVALESNNNFRNLKSIGLGLGFRFGDRETELLGKFGTSFPVLESVTPGGLRPTYPYGNPADELQYLSNLSHLRELNLYACSLTGFPSCELAGLKRLQKLELPAFDEEEEQNDDDESGDEPKSPVLMFKGPSLFEFEQKEPMMTSLVDLTFSYQSPAVNSGTFGRIRFHAPNLRNLQVSISTASAISEIAAAKFPLLDSLYLITSQESAFDDAFFQQLSTIARESSPNIRKLRLLATFSDATDKGFSCLTHFKQLESLILESAYGSGTPLTGCLEQEARFPPSLKEMRLKSCSGITDEGLKSMLRSLSLEVLELYNIPQITSEGLTSAFETSENCKTSLRELSIECFGWSTVKNLCFLKAVPCVKKLTLNLPERFKFKEIRENSNEIGLGLLPLGLEDLTMQGSLIGNVDFIEGHVPAHLKNSLKRLDLKEYHFLSEEAFLKFVSEISTLEYLNVHKKEYGRYNLYANKEAFKSIAEKLPRLKRIEVVYPIAKDITEDENFRDRQGSGGEKTTSICV